MYESICPCLVIDSLRNINSYILNSHIQTSFGTPKSLDCWLCCCFPLVAIFIYVCTRVMATSIFGVFPISVPRSRNHMRVGSLDQVSYWNSDRVSLTINFSQCTIQYTQFSPFIKLSVWSSWGVVLYLEMKMAMFHPSLLVLPCSIHGRTVLPWSTIVQNIAPATYYSLV